MNNTRWAVHPGDIVILPARRAKSFGDPGNTQERVEGGRFGSASGRTEEGSAGRAILSQELTAAMERSAGVTGEAAFGASTEEEAAAMKQANVIATGNAIYEQAKTDDKLAAALDGKQPYQVISERALSTGGHWAFDDPAKWNGWVTQQSAEAHWSVVVNPSSGLVTPLEMPDDPRMAAAQYWAASLQSGWAATSGDGNMKAFSMQDAATRVLGAEPNQGLLDSFNENQDRIDLRDGGTRMAQYFGVPMEPGTATAAQVYDAWREAYQPIIDSYVQTTYDRTQAYLADRNITAVTVDRGMNFVSPEAIPPQLADAPVGATVATGSNPLSSWATTEASASRFSRMGGGNYLSPDLGGIIRATFPAASVFSVPATGPGCLSEDEVITIGHAEDRSTIVNAFGPVERDYAAEAANAAAYDI